MSFDKAIEHGKEHRKPYHGAKAFDSCCRNHGIDEWALANRQYKNRKRQMSAEDKMKDW